MLKQKFTNKELINLVDNLKSKCSITKDNDGYLMGIEFNLEKLLNEVKSNKVDVIVSYIQKKLSFLKEYGYEIKEIIYLSHLFIPDTIYVSFLEPVNDSDWEEVLYAKK